MLPTTHILGNGSIGCLWAHALRMKSCPVVFITRSTDTTPFHFTLMEDEQSSSHRTTSHSIPVSASGLDQPIQLLLVCVKTHQLETALLQVAKRISSETFVILLQNGMGNFELAQKCLPPCKIVMGTHTHGAFRKDPQTIIYAGKGETTLGFYDSSHQGGLAHQLMPEHLQHLNTSIGDINWSSDIRSILWQKLAVSAVINPLTAVYTIRNGALFDHELSSQLIVKLIEEMVPIFRHNKLPFETDEIEKSIRLVAKNTASNYSSMLQDKRANQPTEIEAITGFILNEAQQLGLLVPTHKMLYQKLI